MLILAESANTPGLLQVIEVGVNSGVIYALIALGYTLVYDSIKMIHFAHGDVFMWGTVIYFFAVASFHLGNASLDVVTLVIVLLGSLCLCMVFCSALAVLVERVAYRPLSSAPRLTRLVSACMTGMHFHG